MNEFFNKDIISIRDLTKENLESIYDSTNKIIEMDSSERREIARGKALGYLFFEPSTRTRLSFQSAMALIGGTSFGIADVQSSSIQKGESLADTVKIMSGYTDALVLRHTLDGSSRFAAEISEKPLINAGSGTEEHPTQAIQDLFTIKKELKKIDGLKIGIVGGSLTANPAARLGLKITSVKTAEELAMVICSVGLAQNLAALRALVTHGIQKGHMRLHAKSVAMSINTPEKFFDDVVSEMIDSGEIKAWKAQDILHEKTLKQKDPININPKNQFNGLGAAAGKIILFGEHAVVYGESAIALPIENAAQVVIEKTEKCSQFIFNGYEQYILDKESSEYSYMLILVQKICELLEIKNHKFKLNIISRIPISMGLGSSASFAVAIIRAIISLYDLPLTNDRVNAIAFECEKISHGNPSGIDNTVATYGRPILFRKNTKIENLENNNLKSLPILIAISKQSSRTVDVVKEVSLRYEKDVSLYSNIFKQLGRISKDSVIALREHNLEKIGAMMNVSHGLLNAIGISNNELEKMVYLARSKGALGAKITGSGGGGSIIILCPEKEQAITDAFELAGYGIISMNISRCE